MSRKICICMPINVNVDTVFALAVKFADFRGHYHETAETVFYFIIFFSAAVVPVQIYYLIYLITCGKYVT